MLHRAGSLQFTVYMLQMYTGAGSLQLTVLMLKRSR